MLINQISIGKTMARQLSPRYKREPIVLKMDRIRPLNALRTKVAVRDQGPNTTCSMAIPGTQIGDTYHIHPGIPTGLLFMAPQFWVQRDTITVFTSWT